MACEEVAGEQPTLKIAERGQNISNAFVQPLWAGVYILCKPLSTHGISPAIERRR
jgi:hypothetical protein